MITYDAKLMSHLKQYNEISFWDFTKYLDIYLQNLSKVPDSVLPSEYRAFKSFYFDHNNDPQREKPFLDRLVRMSQK